VAGGPSLFHYNGGVSTYAGVCKHDKFCFFNIIFLF